MFSIIFSCKKKSFWKISILFPEETALAITKGTNDFLTGISRIVFLITEKSFHFLFSHPYNLPTVFIYKYMLYNIWHLELVIIFLPGNQMTTTDNRFLVQASCMHHTWWLFNTYFLSFSLSFVSPPTIAFHSLLRTLILLICRK